MSDTTSDDRRASALVLASCALERLSIGRPDAAAPILALLIDRLVATPAERETYVREIDDLAERHSGWSARPSPPAKGIAYVPTIADLTARREHALTMIDTALEMLDTDRASLALDCLRDALRTLAVTPAERDMIARRLDTPPPAPTP